MFIFPSGIPSGSSGYQPSGALYLDGTADELTFTPAVDGTGAGKKYTLSFWFKLIDPGNLGSFFSAGNSGGDSLHIQTEWGSAVNLNVNDNSITSPSWLTRTGNRFMRDTTAWTHFMLACDFSSGGGLAGSANAARLYINGVEHTDFSLANAHPASTNTSRMTMQYEHVIGNLAGGSDFKPFYIADFIIADGQQLATTDLGEFNDNGVWVPISPSGLTFGNNGCWLDFGDGRYPGLDVQSGATGDADFGVKHLMHFDGSDGDDGDDDVRDSGLSAATLSFTGNAQLDTSIKKFGDSSLLLDGSGDEVSFTCPVFGKDNYTIDFWIYPLSGTHNNAAIMGNRAGTGDDCLIIYFKSGYNNRVAMDTPMSNIHLGSSSTELSINTWYHVAFTYDGISNRQFINGTLVDTTATSFNLNRTETWRIGQDNSGNKPNDLNGHIDELRMVHGICKWTTSFTPETSAYSNPTKNNSFIPSSGVGANNIVVDGPANSTDKEITLYPALDPTKKGSSATVAGSNLQIKSSSGTHDNSYCLASQYVTSGKWIAAFKVNGSSGGGFGIANQNIGTSNIYTSNDWYIRFEDTSTFRMNLAGSTTNFSATNDVPGGNDFLLIALDADNSKAWFGYYDQSATTVYWNNGTTNMTGNPATNSGGTSITGNSWTFFGLSGNTSTYSEIDFGSGSLLSQITKPSGFSELTKTVTGTGNYCVQNPIFQGDYTSDVTLSNGNLTVSVNHDGSNAAHSLGTFPMSSGKWYFEVSPTTLAGTHELYFGLMDASHNIQSSNTGSTVFRVIRTVDGDKATTGNGGGTISTYGAGIDVGDTAKVAIDIDAGDIWFGKNAGDTWANGSGSFNQAFGSATAAHTDLDSAASAWLPVYFAVNNGSTNIANINYGQKPFKFTPPTDYRALNTANLAEPTVTKPTDHFKAVKYTLSGSAAQTISPGFGPDLVIIKRRTGGGQHWSVLDSVRGTGYLSCNDDGDENWDGGTSPINAVTDWGASSLSLQSGGKFATDSAGDYIAYCWEAGGRPTATNVVAVSDGATMTANSVFKGGSAHSFTPHNDATIFPEKMSIASHNGFSIVHYEGNATSGAKVPHGLDAAPEMIIMKNFSDNGPGWYVYHTSVGTSNYLRLEQTSGQTSESNYVWNGTAPDANLFTLGGGSSYVNDSGKNHIAYCFKRTSGLIGIGIYTSNDSADGPHVIVDDGASGFKPAFVMLKAIQGSQNWRIHDSARNGYNGSVEGLFPNTTGAEDTEDVMDMVSNGFKIRSANDNVNGGTAGTDKYVYIAFAESPFSLNNRAR